MNRRRKQRLFAVSAAFVLLAAAIGVMLYSLNDSIDVFYTPSEIHNGKEATGNKPIVGQRLRIGGLVVPGSINRANDSLNVSFDLVDTGPKVKVEYNGILPDLFREGQGIIATGELKTPTLIVAHEVLAKHDEEYMPPELAEQLKGMNQFKPANAKDTKAGQY
ncbi:cytochrome c maturation protein CcmE [Agaribacter marinus]|uniref:Cytochrome c-type biogenesis protein CcmE n=1 Tax=Agaribacter marinus TaxID=1431249 RepID=A0AA37T336_9ALTE|nr:cytochrome c maturation protein CcmE [Agaribacter marinus]GLR70900.1 cytochrome c-type biogenesis protein CcmE [Agaribacter marinus]